jgi:hypothetical protein
MNAASTPLAAPTSNQPKNPINQRLTMNHLLFKYKIGQISVS